MRKGLMFFIVIHLCLLAGCWDTHLLKDTTLVLGIGLDAAEEDKVLNTSVIRLIKTESGGTGNPPSTNAIYSSVGSTLRETRVDIEKQLSGEYAANKMQVLVIGEELAKKDIYPILDAFYRDPRNSLGAKLVIAQGPAKDLLEIKKSKEVFIIEKLRKVIQRTEDLSLIPMETIQSVCPDFYDPGKDFALPYVVTKDSDSFEIKGAALFHDKKFTGKVLEGEDATILLYMNGEAGDVARFKFKVNPEEERLQNQFVTTNIFLKDQSLKVKVDKNQKISAEINLKLNITVVEYPSNQLFKKEKVLQLNEEISKQLNKKAESVLKELQDANCDYFGIGRKLIAYHPETWKEIEWADAYPTIDIKAKVDAEITGVGIIK